MLQFRLSHCYSNQTNQLLNKKIKKIKTLGIKLQILSIPGTKINRRVAIIINDLDNQYLIYYF